MNSEPRPTLWQRLRSIPIGVWKFALLLLLLLSPFLVRAMFLLSVPDIGDPFDVADFCKSMHVPPEQDALTVYRNAGGLYTREYWDAFSGQLGAGGYWGVTNQEIDPILTQGWGVAGDNVKKWVVAHDASLREWKRATEMDRVGFNSTETLLTIYERHDLGMVPYLDAVASLRGRRCEAENDFAGAFQWYRARIRSKLRLPGWHGFSLREQEFRDIVRWAALPEVTSAELRTAMSQLRRDWASFRPASDAIKIDYIHAINSLRSRDGLYTALSYRSGNQTPIHQRSLRQRLTLEFWRYAYWTVGEPERTRRIYQHLVANQLRAIDLAGSKRRATNPASATLMYVDDPAVPLPSAHLSADRLAAAIQNSAIASQLEYTGNSGAFLFRNVGDDWFLQESRAGQVLLELMLALQAHYRDHGAFPSKLEELVPDYIDAVPVDPCDPAAQNIRYKIDISDLATVWSVGTNGTDDNGLAYFSTGDAVLDVRAPEGVITNPSPKAAKD